MTDPQQEVAIKVNQLPAALRQMGRKDNLDAGDKALAEVTAQAIEQLLIMVTKQDKDLENYMKSFGPARKIGG
jgi:hypothetical protein